MQIATLFNHVRGETEGDVAGAYAAAIAAGFPEKAAKYLSLSVAWRQHELEFRGLCSNMADDEELPLFWRASALESLAATTPSDKPGEQLAHFDAAEAMVSALDEKDLDRIYIETCCAAGRSETPGEPPAGLEQRHKIATIMVANGWFNAPGRMKSYCDALAGDDASADGALLLAFRAKQENGKHSFSPRQTKILLEAHGRLFKTK